MTDFQEGLIKLISKVWKDCCVNFRKEPLLIVNFCLSDNMEQKYKEIRPDHEEKFSKLIEHIIKCNALTITPSQTSENFYVLIDLKYFVESLEKNNNWAGTVAHELTHIYDMIKYADLIGCHDYDTILDLYRHWMFNIWTEYHAKVIRHYCVNKYFFKDVYNKS